MNLGDFLTPDDALVAEAEFPEDGSGFYVSVRYLPPDEMRRISQDATGRMLAVKGGKVDVRDETVEQEVARRIVSWRGLTPELAATFIAGLRASAFRAALDSQGLSEIPCTDANRLLIVKRGRGFLNWVDGMATSVEHYREKQVEAEIKN